MTRKDTSRIGSDGDDEAGGVEENKKELIVVTVMNDMIQVVRLKAK